MLKNMNKGTTPEQNIEAARVIGSRGLKLIAAFVLGAPGETEASLQNTLKHVEEISKAAELEAILCSPWLPLPGSWSFEQIRDKYTGMDDIDLIEAKKEWIRRICSVDIDTIKYYANKILEFAPIRDVKGEEKTT